MADPDFETSLVKMFAEPPVLPDPDGFARLVEARLDRGWTLRQALIWTLGLAGGVIGVSQMLPARLMSQMEGASKESTQLIHRGLVSLSDLQGSLNTLPLGGEVVWMAAALGVMALAFAITRAVEEF
ncbi:MAG TPA: hypothetical protein VFN88_00485 [Caulobacteraceae bacterium]|jgi:hypothetical protein|nr:hypothetical protein [Caulobacteraceae bacterium]